MEVTYDTSILRISIFKTFRFLSLHKAGKLWCLNIKNSWISLNPGFSGQQRKLLNVLKTVLTGTLNSKCQVSTCLQMNLWII